MQTLLQIASLIVSLSTSLIALIAFFYSLKFRIIAVEDRVTRIEKDVRRGKRNK